jgi:hypothetical protein
MPDLTTVARVKEWLRDLPNGEVLGALDIVEGNGYHAATTTVSLAGVIGQGSGFAADPIIVGGKFKGIVIRIPGSLYLKGTPPVLVITDTDIVPGSGAGASLNIADINGTQDVLLARIVSAASEFFRQQTSRNVYVSAPVTEVRHGRFGQRYITLRESPVTAVASLSIDGTVATVSPDPRSPGYGFDADGVFLRGLSFTDGFSNIAISYTAGYATLPSDVEDAVIDLAATRYQRRTHVDEVSRALSASGSTTVSFSQKDISAYAQTVIDKYSRPMIFGG